MLKSDNEMTYRTGCEFHSSLSTSRLPFNRKFSAYSAERLRVPSKQNGEGGQLFIKTLIIFVASIIQMLNEPLSALDKGNSLLSFPHFVPLNFEP